MLIVLRKGKEKVKGLLLLLDAFKILKKDLCDVTLHVVGTELSPIDGVLYYLNPSQSEKEYLYRHSSLYVMPAIREPNGITYLEALAHKTPIVGLNRFAIPEFTNDGEYGIVVSNSDPYQLAIDLKIAMKNPNKLEQMGLLGQKYVEQNYSWDMTIAKIFKIVR